MSVTIRVSTDLIQSRLDPSAETLGEIGAMLDFFGVVRSTEDGKLIRGIDYEAFVDMAEHQLRVLAEAQIEQRSIRSLECIHRIGFVAVGEASLYVRITSAHRAEALVAMMDFITELKRLVPIWKHPVA